MKETIVNTGTHLLMTIDSFQSLLEQVSESTAKKIMKEQYKKVYLSTTEVSNQKGVAVNTVKDWINRGRKKGKTKIYLKAIRTSENGNYMICQHDLDEFMKKIKE